MRKVFLRVSIRRAILVHGGTKTRNEIIETGIVGTAIVAPVEVEIVRTSLQDHWNRKAFRQPTSERSANFILKDVDRS